VPLVPRPLRIGVISLASPSWLAGQSFTEVVLDGLRGARTPGREELCLIAPGWAATPREGVEIVRLPDADLSLAGRARRGLLRARDRLPSLPGEWSVRRRLALAEPSNPVHAARLAGIDVVIPAVAVHAPGVGLPSVGWIPDFQHRFLPGAFPASEIAERDDNQGALAAHCARMIFSSRAVERHFAELYPAHAHKARVASFPSQLAFRRPEGDPRGVLARYGLPERFALVVNQFWAHKNHGVVVDALARLVARGRGVPVVMVGGLGDYRDPQGRYLSELLQRIARARIGEHLWLLGKVPFGDLVDLLRCAAVVVQPSRFEGWNTTVEDALALGRPVLCSDIEVHREQAPGAVGFFGCDRPDELAEILEARWDALAAGPDVERERAALEAEGGRAARYGEILIRTCHEAAGA
jgi:glycosyltransferase involved in cell wall biosynthesis